MRQFDTIDPAAMANDPRIVASVDDPNSPGRKYYLMVDGDYLLLTANGYWTAFGKSKWLGYQLEFPKRGLPWFVDTIEKKFFGDEEPARLPSGILPASESSLHLTVSIDGERLKVQRCFGLGKNSRESGYDFTTVDRRDPNISKELSFTDTALFEQGLFDWFKENAEKVRQRQL